MGKHKKDEVTVVSIGVGTMPKSKLKKMGASKMAMGGMANGKKHMYAGGGSVMENLTPGQRKMVMAMARDNKTA